MGGVGGGRLEPLVKTVGGSETINMTKNKDDLSIVEARIYVLLQETNLQDLKELVLANYHYTAHVCLHVDITYAILLTAT